MLTLRFDGESDDEFRVRAERAVRVAKVLVSACLPNRCMLRYIADPSLPYTEDSVRVSPTVRVEYEQAIAIAIGDLGSCLSATTSKRWGDGPWVMPLEPDDEFFPDRVAYIYRANSLYNRRLNKMRQWRRPHHSRIAIPSKGLRQIDTRRGSRKCGGMRQFDWDGKAGVHVGGGDAGSFRGHQRLAGPFP